jgi:hypothetical protein
MGLASGPAMSTRVEAFGETGTEAVDVGEIVAGCGGFAQLARSPNRKTAYAPNAG